MSRIRLPVADLLSWIVDEQPLPERETALGGGRRDFPSTCWSRFMGEGPADPALREASMRELSSRYWKPVYLYVRALRPVSIEDAKDLTQDFFVWAMETGFLDNADPDRGSFRGYVKTSLKNFLASEDRKTKRLKRGGDKRIAALEEAMVDLPGAGVADPKGRSPEQVLDDAWRGELLVRAADQLRESLTREGKEVYFKVFRDYHLDRGEKVIHREVAARHSISESDVSNFLRVAKLRYRDILKDLVSVTVRGQRDLMEEWASLFGPEEG